jgi:hypothetical protein
MTLTIEITCKDPDLLLVSHEAMNYIMKNRSQDSIARAIKSKENVYIRACTELSGSYAIALSEQSVRKIFRVSLT